MYGVIYVAIKDYAEATLGPEKWETVLKQSGVTVDFTVTEQPYNDEITYQLVQAIARAAGQDIDETLYAVGYNVIMVTNARYKNIMSSRGETLREYLINLPNFHNRISLIYPELTPPEFRVSDIQDGTMLLHYRNRRLGMQEYVRGYLTALADVFKEKISIVPVLGSDDKIEMIFKISW